MEDIIKINKEFYLAGVEGLKSKLSQIISGYDKGLFNKEEVIREIKSEINYDRPKSN